MSVVAPSLPVDPLIAEAKQRARRRRLLVMAAAGILLAGGVAIEHLVTSGGGSPGAIPWLPTKPNIGQVIYPLAPPCTASQLGENLGYQGGDWNLPGWIMISNRSDQACALVGRPKLAFSNFRMVAGPKTSIDPLAPPLRSLRALAPGRHVQVLLGWRPTRCTFPGNGATTLVLSAPGGGTIRRNVDMYCSVPSGSAFVAPFRPFAPYGKTQGSPLSARIVGVVPVTFNGRHFRLPGLAAKPGSWLSYTVVLKNPTRQVFRFGRSCPAYTEDWDWPGSPQAYVLNCHPVGSIAPGGAARFAMRVRVPHLQRPVAQFYWTLEPHAFDSPQARAIVDLR